MDRLLGFRLFLRSVPAGLVRTRKLRWDFELEKTTGSHHSGVLMFRCALILVFTIVWFASVRSVAENKVLAELRFEAHNRAEKTAGVWVDGQYLGYVKELAGNKKVLLLPGKHEIVVRQPWYEDYVEQPVLEPGGVHLVSLALVKDGRTPRSQEASGELKIAASPARAAVFVDNAFAGHADEFDGVGKAMLLTPGTHHLRIALPGYLPFDTVVDLRPRQKVKIETQLEKGSVEQAGALVSQK